jgi:hypothetical protein
MLTQCKGKNSGGGETPIPPTPIETGIKITGSMKNSTYIVHAGENVYVTDGVPKTFENDLLDLKALSDADSEHRTLFTVAGHVNFGFLVDPDMDCHINGIDSALAICISPRSGTPISTSQGTVGVTIGRKDSTGTN